QEGAGPSSGASGPGTVESPARAGPRAPSSSGRTPPPQATSSVAASAPIARFIVQPHRAAWPTAPISVALGRVRRRVALGLPSRRVEGERPMPTWKQGSARVAATVAVLVVSIPEIALAAERFGERRTADQAAYPLEVDAHLAFGPKNVYGDNGF